jgi:hypothetical protein
MEERELMIFFGIGVIMLTLTIMMRMALKCTG